MRQQGRAQPSCRNGEGPPLQGWLQGLRLTNDPDTSRSDHILLACGHTASCRLQSAFHAPYDLSRGPSFSDIAEVGTLTLRTARTLREPRASTVVSFTGATRQEAAAGSSASARPATVGCTRTKALSLANVPSQGQRQGVAPSSLGSIVESCRGTVAATQPETKLHVR